MNADILLLVFVAIILADYIFELWLNLLTIKSLEPEAPENLKDIFDEKQYKKSQDYTKTQIKFDIVKTSFFTFLLIFSLVFGWWGKLDTFLRNFVHSDFWLSVFYFETLILIIWLLNIPFSYYDTFVIEEKFGFNKTTKKTFFADKIKVLLLNVILTGIIAGFIVWFYFKTGKNFWIYAFMVITLINLFLTMFYTNLILPLFNKLSPLQDQELKQSISDFARKVNFPLQDIFQIDASKRSAKGNAFFSGLGKKKKIVLYDTILEKLDSNEIVAVLAHEIGHFKKKHILKSFIISSIVLAVELYILSLLMDNPVLSQALGASQVSFHLSFIAFGIIFNPVNTFLSVIMNIFSRKHEYEADRFAAENYDPRFLISALKKLAKQNLTNLTPHKTVVLLTYSHPPLKQRIEFLEKFSAFERKE